MLRFMALGALVFGLAMVHVGRRALAGRRPFVARGFWFVAPGLILMAIEPAMQCIASFRDDDRRRPEDPEMWMLIIATFAPALLASAAQMVQIGGYTIVGASELVVRRALKSVFAAQDLQHRFDKRTIHIDGIGRFTIEMNDVAHTANLRARPRAARRLLTEAIPLIEACFRSAELKLDPAYWRRRVKRGWIVTTAAVSATIVLWSI